MEEQDLTIDWSQAEVADGELSVPLSDKPPKGWKDGFERTMKLLGESRWQDVTLKKGSIRVGGVEPGSEDNLRFYLEGLVEQANADIRPDEPQDTGESVDDGGDESDNRGPDAEMTGRFRGFAEADAEDGDGDGDSGRQR